MSATPCSHTHKPPAQPDMSDVLLPTSVKPTRYQLTIASALSDKKFRGRVVAHVTCAAATDAITLHSLGLVFGAPNVRLIAEADAKAVDAKAGAAVASYSAPPPAWNDGAHAVAGESAVACSGVTFDEKQQTATLKFASALKVGGRYRLVINYSAALNAKLAGFYLSEYKTPDAQTHYVGVTQFEPTDARRALPCWDEPALKATFELVLVVPKHFEAIGNGPLVERKLVGAGAAAAADAKAGGAAVDDVFGESGYVWHRYGESPKMSTYLLAWVLGEVDAVCSHTPATGDGGSVAVRVLTPIGKSDLGGFALRVTAGALAFFAQYFNIPYSAMLPKVDLIAIPDFAAGAMENYGCITYRETALLIDERQSSAIAKQRVARTVCHELAHMWFGNLVTMQWWDGLWLNEGFARLMEFHAVNHLFPDWHIFDSFVDEVFSLALSLDSLANSHPIEVAVHHPSEINEIFDSISYAKGASVLRMLHDHIGAAAFKAGLRIYLNRHKWANALSDHLWAALSEASGADVKALMGTWLHRTGYPLLKIREIPAKAGGARRFAIAQERFLADGSAEAPLTPGADGVARDAKGRPINRALWTVPISIDAFDADSKQAIACQTLVLSAESAEFELPNVPAKAALKFNRNQSGFYRIEYTPELLAPVLTAGALAHWSAADRLGIQGDVFAAAKAGRLPITAVLDVTKHYAQETEYCVVNSLVGNLVGAARVHADAPYFADLQRFIRAAFDRLYTALGWDARDGEDNITQLKRTAVLSVMAFAGDERVIAEAQNRFAKFVANPTASPLRADLRGLVYGTAVKHDTPATASAAAEGAAPASAYDSIVKLLVDPLVSAEERQRLLDAAGRTRDPARVGAAIDLAFSEKVRTQDVPWIFGSIGGSSAVGRAAAWQYLQTQWKAIYGRFHEAGFLIPRIVSAAIGGWADAQKATEIEQFFAANPCAEADRVIKQCLETVRANAGRLARETKPLAAYLAAHK